MLGDWQIDPAELHRVFPPAITAPERHDTALPAKIDALRRGIRRNCCWRRRSALPWVAPDRWLDGRFRPSLAYPVPCRDTLGLWAVAPAANGSPG